MSIFALVDCNNFYASCERAFNPALEGKPVVVLSNNDGCIIARSNEAKALGIPMGAPFYQWKLFCNQHHVRVFSSNYELYGDMSQRVMNVLKDSCPDIEIYSIDEAFLLLDGFNHQDLVVWCKAMRKKIKDWLGLPTSIGFAQTKTLAKMANVIAKKEIPEGVYAFQDTCVQLEKMAHIPVGDIWGVGRRLSKRLQQLNIHTALDLRRADPKELRLQFSVVMEKLVQELNGISCIPVEAVQPRQQIMSSRSFGKIVTELNELEEAVSLYTARACIRLRQQNSVAEGIYVFIHTNPFRENEPAYQNGCAFQFPLPSAYTPYMVSIAKKCLRQLYRKGYKYHKAGIMLLGIQPETIQQYDMLQTPNVKDARLMEMVDSINEKMGRDSIYYCAQGIIRPWQLKSTKRSPCYTTRWNELVKAYC